MNLLVTRVPALVYPYHRQREQPLRVEKLKDLLPMRILDDRDLEPTILSNHIEQMLLNPPAFESVNVNINGAGNAARYLEEWAPKNA